VAAAEQAEQAGSDRYQTHHMNAIFKEGFSFSGYERDLLVMNLGGERFLDVSGVSGVDSISDGRGTVFADFDNDGDTDIFLTTVQGEAHYLFRNNVGSRNAFLRVALEGTRAGRDAFGAVVRLRGPEGVRSQVKAGGSGYVSQNDPRLLFGLGADGGTQSVEVIWPGGERQRFGDVPAGASIRIVQGADRYAVVAESRFRLVDPLDAEEALLAGLGFKAGGPFPSLELRPASGEPRRLHELLQPGRRCLVNLWATWCGPCAKEMPELQKLHVGLREAGVDLIGISVDLDTAGQVPEYVRSRGIRYPIFTTDQAAMELLYPRGEATVPLTVLLDERGQVLEIFSGWSERSERALRELVSGRVGG
jgi:peroxiredoxin